MATIKHTTLWWPAFVILVVTNCVEPYQPPVTKEETNILVIDGYINTTAKAAKVKLSRTIGLSKSQQFPAETKAVVSIESEDGGKYPMLEKTGGNYESTGLNLSPLKRYRLNIKTLGGGQYQSDYIGLNPAPIIDSIGWSPDETGTTVYANAHDPTGVVKYYKWNYTETWEYFSNYESLFKLVKGVPIVRKPDEYIYKCWKTEIAPSILLSTTFRLSEAQVHQFPLTFLPVGTLKLSRKYSMMVTLRGVGEEEYLYWQQLKKTTENLGGLFDPLPSQVTGNVHSETNPTETVLGYFSGGAMQEKRIFISFYDLPNYLLKISKPYCVEDSVPIPNLKGYGSALLLITSYGDPNPIGYLTSADECIDCRLAGGTTTKPDFWK